MICGLRHPSRVTNTQPRDHHGMISHEPRSMIIDQIVCSLLAGYGRFSLSAVIGLSVLIYVKTSDRHLYSTPPVVLPCKQPCQKAQGMLRVHYGTPLHQALQTNAAKLESSSYSAPCCRQSGRRRSSKLTLSVSTLLPNQLPHTLYCPLLA